MMEVPTDAAPQIPLLSSEEQIRPVRLQKYFIKYSYTGRNSFVGYKWFDCFG